MILRCVLSAACYLLIAATGLSSQESRVSRGHEGWGHTRLERGDEMTLVRAIDDAMRRSRATDGRLHWEGHFLQGPADGRIYVPYTLRIADAGDAFANVAVAVRAVGFDGAYNDAFAMTTERDGNDRLFRSALVVAPGRRTLYIAVQDRSSSSRVWVMDRVITVPNFAKGLKLSSIVLVDRVEDAPESSSNETEDVYPYSFGPVHLVPARDAEFKRTETLTVAFQVYNPATFEDGRPDVEVHYRVVRAGKNGKPIGATEPQLFDQETLPEEFSLKAGNRLTPVQSFPLAQFEPGEYRLEIDVQDYLGNQRARADVGFTIVP